jgi:hypothetical protein
VKIADYSPVTSPSLDRQRDALQKGLGRAIQWAMAGQLDEALLLDACLHDLRYDGQCEESRGTWLWQIIQVLHAEARFRSAILAAMQSFTEVRTAQQLCELAFHYASAGDEAFRSRLYQIVEVRPFDDIPWLVEWPILQLDGEQGFLFAARIRGQQLEKREWEWDDQYLLDQAIERFGEGRVDELLRATTDGTLARYRDIVLQKKSESKERTSPRQDHAERMRQIPVSEIISSVELLSGSQQPLRGWGIWANENDLETVFQHLLSSSEPRMIVNYLKVFSRRNFPRIVPELVSLSQHSDAEVRRLAFNALKNNSHPLVRELAELELKKGSPCDLALGLFIKNYQQGDEQRILESIELPGDEIQLHWLLMDAAKILKENPQADCSKLGMVVYALTPCGNCRGSAAQLLHDRRVAPSWLIEECRFDSEADTRKLVTNLSRPSDLV